MSEPRDPLQASELQPLTDAEIRRSTYMAVLLTLLLPPFVAPMMMSLVGFYPFPKIYYAFTVYVGVYVAAVSALLLALTPRAVRFVVGLPSLELPAGREAAQRAFTRLPWLILIFIGFYTAVGTYLADLSMEHLGYRDYLLRDHFYNQFGDFPVILISAFPIFFFYADRLGRYLGPRGISIPAIPLWVKLVMLGIVIPFLIDSLLIGYHLNRTGTFEWQALVLWVSLLLLSTGATWLAWRSLRQGMAPLEAFVHLTQGSLPERASASLRPLSLDELGVLTARYAELLVSQQRAESLADTVVERAGALVVLLDGEGRIVRFNQAAEKLSGYSFAEVEGKYPWDTILPPEEAAAIRKSAFESLANDPQKLAGRFTNHWLSRDGKRYLTEWTNTVVTNERGRMQYMVSIGADVTEHHRMQAELRDNEERVRLALASANQGLYDLNVQTGEAIVSPEYATMLGYDPAEFHETNAAWRERLHPDDAQAVYQVYADYVAGRRPDYRVEFRQRTKGGDWKWILSLGKIMSRDAEGRPLRMLGTHTDLTERKRIEDELRHHREQLEEVVRERTRELREAQRIAHIGNGYWDLVSGAVTWSDEMFALLGYDRRQRSPSYELFERRVHPDDRAKMRKYNEEVLSGVRTGGIDHRLILEDGTLRWVHAEVAAHLGADGKPIGIAGILHDITARKQVEQELILAKESAERANKAKSEFLARMSHELRTPMNAILGFAQILEMEELSSEQQEFVREIHRAGDHLLELINELLDLSRIEAGKLTITIQTTSVCEVVNEAIALSKSLIQENQISVLNHCPHSALVLADPIRLRQVMVNLLSNAAKYNRKGGCIDIDCALEGDGCIRIAVRDTGQGIEPEKLKKLFRPFERIGAEYRTIDGAGIGLALSKRITEMMSGTIGVESVLGMGSTFWVELPVAQANQLAKRPTADAKAVPSERHYTVLYIEDNPANLRVVQAIFRRYQETSLLSASTGAFGLELARRYRPDVILLDIHLPDIDGYAVLELLRSDPSTRNLPVIAVSADAMPPDIERGRRAGFRGYLTKPLNVDQLLSTIQQYLPTATLSAPAS
jgi:PAS domain S-box-containing protein